MGNSTVPDFESI